MVAKLAQAIASGDVPDLMGMDLIYAPQFEKAGQLVDLTGLIGNLPELKTASPGHMMVATFDKRIYGVPLYADVSALFYNKDLFEKAGLDPNKPPRSLPELRQDADKITALGGDIKGYYLPGSCAGCNIFTVGPLMWASGAKIEAKDAGDEPLVGDGVAKVLQFERDMVKSGNVHASDRAENGETFHLQFGSGKVGMMGTGNFNIKLARDQNPNMKFGISLLPGMEPGSSASFIGGDLVVVPKGSKRVNDAVDFMKFILSDEVQVEGYAKLLNLTTRADMVDNKYFKAEPLVQDVAKALTVGTHPLYADLLRADKLASGSVAANAAASVLHRRPDRSDHQGCESADEGDRRSVNGRRRFAALQKSAATSCGGSRRHLGKPRSSSRQRSANRQAAALQAAHERGEPPYLQRSRCVGLRGYEGFADVQHSGERVNRRVISDADCVVCLCVYRVSVRPDGMDVASQLVFTGDEKMGWLGKFY